MESNIEVPIMHDGKELHLRLDLGAMELFEETFGEPLSSVFKRFESMGLKGEFPIKETRQLLYTLLKHENPDLAYEDTLRMAPYPNEIAKAIGISFGIEDTELPLAPNRAAKRAARKTKTKKPTG